MIREKYRYSRICRRGGNLKNAGHEKVAGELLVELEKKGVTFETVDGKLKYKDSKGNFTENSKEKVKNIKKK